MASERRRLLELALESLENQRKQIDIEFAELTRELRGAGRRKSKIPVATRKAEVGGRPKRKRSRFSKEERLRRAQRMTAYWEDWRRQRAKEK